MCEPYVFGWDEWWCGYDDYDADELINPCAGCSRYDVDCEGQCSNDD